MPNLAAWYRAVTGDVGVAGPPPASLSAVNIAGSGSVNFSSFSQQRPAQNARWGANPVGVFDEIVSYRWSWWFGTPPRGRVSGARYATGFDGTQREIVIWASVFQGGTGARREWAINLRCTVTVRGTGTNAAAGTTATLTSATRSLRFP